MTQEEFIQRIQATPLYDDQQKQYFISQAGDYSPELRVKLIVILEKHEQNLLEYSEAQHAEHAQKAHEKMRKMEEAHRKVDDQETVEAEAQLVKDLENL